MILQRLESLKPIIESKNGLHLTAYVQKSEGNETTRQQLAQMLRSASEQLSETLEQEDLRRFLAPLQSFLRDEKLLGELKGNIGIFRNSSSFRVLNVPVEVENLCVVATSFHVKPLLRWMQLDREFLLLGLKDRSAALYRGNLHSLRFLDATLLSANGRNSQVTEIADWLKDWLTRFSETAPPRLFLAGNRGLSEALFRVLDYPNLHPRTVCNNFKQEDTAALAQTIRSLLRGEARRTLERSLLEFHCAEDLNLGKKNLFQVAKAVVEGKVRKLIIADGIQIFGRLNRHTGGLSLNHIDSGLKDDDILDDLAQLVLSQGGEVIVARKEEIPKGTPALAILERSGERSA
jgi:hypothetical protein